MFPNILIELKKRRYSQQGLAKYIGISRSSMQNKMNGQRPFTLPEMRAIQQALDGCTLDGRTCWTNAQRGRYRKAVGGRNGKEPQVCFPGIEWALFAQKGRSRVQRSFQETYIPQPINPFYHNPCPIVRTLSRKGWIF